MPEITNTTALHDTRAEELRQHAATIRENVHAREAIAAAFELIAEAMTPCEDCGAPVLPVLDDLPAALVPNSTTDTTGQAAA